MSADEKEAKTNLANELAKERNRALDLQTKLHERDDWWQAFPGRGHHADWCAAVKHPDMQLIEAAPDMLDALRKAVVI